MSEAEGQVGKAVGGSALASLQSCDCGLLQSLIEVLAPTNYVARERKCFLLVNEGFSFDGLTASNCRGALAFPREQEGSSCGSALSWLTGIFQLLASVFLTAQWGDDLVCCVLDVRKQDGGQWGWGGGRVGPGGCYALFDTLAGLWEACSGLWALCDLDSPYLPEAFLALTSSEPVTAVPAPPTAQCPPVQDPCVWERGTWMGAAPPDLPLRPLWGAFSLGPLLTGTPVD